MGTNKNIFLWTFKVIVGAALMIAGYVTYAYLHKVDIGERVVSVIVEPGDNFGRIAAQLVDEGVVGSRIMLKYPARWMEIDKKLVPGRYDFTGENSCRSVLDKLRRGDFLRLRMTVYEGMPVWRVASVMARDLEVDSARVMELSQDSAFLDQLGIPTLEGYLFPETYFIPWGTDVKDVLTDMVDMFHAKTDSIWPTSLPRNMTRKQIIILASIVEAEAKLDREKPIISSVYHNRLRRNMRLDADPTVIYGLGGLDRPLYKKDLRKVTPYNTYRMKGLPPTPINSPGLAAIEAAIHPDSTDYLYFVADGTGGHRFSRTNAEHNRARYEIRQNSR